MDRMGHFIQIEAKEHGAEPQAMVSMEMADEDAGDAGRWEVGKDELSLRPFARIEEQSLSVPAQEISALIAKARLLLARTAEDRQVSHAHSTSLQKG